VGVRFLSASNLTNYEVLELLDDPKALKLCADMMETKLHRCLEIVSRIRFLSNCRYSSRVNLNVMVHRGTWLLSE
jgi:hypothetical protein